jgi:hypothetical protein
LKIRVVAAQFDEFGFMIVFPLKAGGMGTGGVGFPPDRAQQGHLCAPGGPVWSLKAPASPHDQHYTVSELDKRWHLSPNTVRRLVVDEPGVIKLTVGPLLRNRRKRHLVSLRIPERVALRVHAKLSE